MKYSAIKKSSSKLIAKCNKLSKRFNKNNKNKANYNSKQEQEE